MSQSNALEYRVIGPPGTGKTTWIRNEVAARVNDGYAPSDIVLTSFTKAAAVLLGEHANVPSDNAATLHALAYRDMRGSAPKGPPIVEVHLAKEWNEQQEFEAWKIDVRGGSEDSAVDGKAAFVPTVNPHSNAGDLLSAYNFLRATGQPSRDVLITYDIDKFVERWEAFKQEHFAVDFGDMLQHAEHEMTTAPGDPAILIVDEAQDFVPQQWRVVRKWAEAPGLERFIVAGDPAQVLYGFLGAKPDLLLEPLPPERVRVLSQSYRLRPEVQNYAERLLSAHSGAMMEGRVYAPRDDGHGVVRHSPATFHHPGPLLHDLLEQAKAGRTTMVLTTSAYMLFALIKLFRQHGVLFWNPYRPSRRDWNPLGGGDDDSTRTIDRVRSLLKARDDLPWNETDWLAVVGMLKASAFPKRGQKARAQRGEIPPAPDGTYHVGLPDPEAGDFVFTDEAMTAFVTGDLKWLAENCVSASMKRGIDYCQGLIRQFGSLDFDDKPQTIIGTIHSVKGAEADVVYVFPDFSAAAWHNASDRGAFTEGRDAMIRVMYVALTRAREEVVVCTPVSEQVLPMVTF